MRRRYHVLDVFTDTALAGNPLAVVLDADGLDAPRMQAVAREFNLSETVFVAAPRDPVNSARLRIFTPAAELPFAGHPTIGTAVLLATLNAGDLLARQDVGLVLEEPIGPVTCSVRHRRGEAAHARFEAPRLAEPVGAPPNAAALAATFGLAADEIGFADHRPSAFSAGNPFIFVPLASLDALARAELAGNQDGPRRAYYLYTPTPSEPGHPRAFRSRMLAGGLGVTEDPATGSAAVAFAGAWLAAERLRDGEHDCHLLQGVEMGRPSTIGLAFAVADGRLARIDVGGSAVLVAQGTLDV